MERLDDGGRDQLLRATRRLRFVMVARGLRIDAGYGGAGGRALDGADDQRDRD